MAKLSIRNLDGPNPTIQQTPADLTKFQALATPEYQIYSGDKILGGIGDNWQEVVTSTYQL